MSYQSDWLKSLSPKEKQELALYCIRGANTSERIAKMDNRELLWWTLQTEMYQNMPIDGSFEEALRGELEDRLYPEYNGDSVKLADWGWITPEGPIVYIKTDFSNQTEA